MSNDIRLDSGGIAEILKSSAVRAALTSRARAAASSAEGSMRAHGSDGDVIVEQYTTDRAHVLLVARDPRASGMEAKYGVLTRAAAGQGLDVNRR